MHADCAVMNREVGIMQEAADTVNVARVNIIRNGLHADS